MDQFLRYKILRKIDSGASATVYQAFDSVLKRDVALKILHPHLLEHPNSLKRFTIEASAIAQLSNENIVKIYDSGEHEGKPYIVMEYVDGVTLDELIERCKVIPNLVLLEIVKQSLSGLNAVHEKEIYHRDIKPGNLIIDKKGCIKITDFGIAYCVDQDALTVTGSILGTPQYISPEQAEGITVTGKTDIFSLGSLAYECATGKPPFNGENVIAVINSIAHDTQSVANQINDKTLTWISGFIDSMLVKEPQLRPDAKQCIDRIGDGCRNDNLLLGRQRVIDFISNPEEYVQKECDELFVLYRGNARTYLKNRRSIQCIRSLQQAKAFAPLPIEDEKIVSSFGQNTTLKKWSVVLAAAVIASAFVIIGWQKILLLKSPGSPVTSIRQKESDDDRNKTKRTNAPSIQNPFIQDKELSKASQTIPFNNLFSNNGKSDIRRPIREVKLSGSPVIPENPQTPGYIHIVTNPPWVKIFLDGIEMGETPKRGVFAALPGKHYLLLRKESFLNFEDSILINPSDTLLQMITMKPAQN